MRLPILVVSCCLLLASSAEAVESGSETAASGKVSATLTYTAKGGAVSSTLTVSRDGKQVLERQAGVRACGKQPAEFCGPPSALYGPPAKSLTVRDVDGDGEPEVIVDFFTGGAHCCTSTDITYWTSSGYRTRWRDWGNGGYVLKQLDGRGPLEWVARDDRFAYRFEAYAFSGLPVKVARLSVGRFLFVTDRFKSTLRADAAEQWKSYLRVRKEGHGRGFAAAWAADQYRLGRRSQALRTLRSEARRGNLRGDKLITGAGSAAQFIAQLDSKLRRWGFVR